MATTGKRMHAPKCIIYTDRLYSMSTTFNCMSLAAKHHIKVLITLVGPQFMHLFCNYVIVDWEVH